MESLRFQLFSPAPIHPELEKVRLANSLTFLAENLGGAHPLMVKVLGDHSPATRATELIDGCKLSVPPSAAGWPTAERKQLKIRPIR